MNKWGKVGILAGSLVFTLATAAIIFVAISSSNIKMKTKEYTELDKTFTKVNLDTSISDVEFKISDNLKVVCEETSKEFHVVSVEDKTLNIKFESHLRFYEKMFGWGKNYKVTIYLPNTGYDQLTINASTGDIYVPSLNFNKVTSTMSTGNLSLDNVSVSESLNLKASTGNIKLSDVKAKNLTAEVSTGNIQVFKNIIAENMSLKTSTGNQLVSSTTVGNKMTFNASTGNIEVNESDANEIYGKASTGNIKMNFLTDKIIFAKSSTGHINDYPHLKSGGTCEAETSTGNITITIKGY